MEPADTAEAIREAIRGFLLTEFFPGEEPAALGNDSPLVSSGLLDSIALLRVVAFLEERFGITLEAHESDVDNLDSVGQIARLVESKR